MAAWTETITVDITFIHHTKMQCASYIFPWLKRQVHSLRRSPVAKAEIESESNIICVLSVLYLSCMDAQPFATKKKRKEEKKKFQRMHTHTYIPKRDRVGSMCVCTCGALSTHYSLDWIRTRATTNAHTAYLFVIDFRIVHKIRFIIKRIFRLWLQVD